MSQDRTLEVSEAQIAVHWREEEYVPRRRRSSSRRPTCRPRHLRTVQPRTTSRTASRSTPTCSTWDKPWHTDAGHQQPAVLEVVRRRQAQRLLQLRRPASCRAQEQGRDHLRARAGGTKRPRHDHLPGAATARVNEFAALLRDFCGLKAGDRVTLHMPMVPELPVTMLACARLGVIHSEVFGGFSGDACGRPRSPTPAAAS